MFLKSAPAALAFVIALTAPAMAQAANQTDNRRLDWSRLVCQRRLSAGLRTVC